MNARQAGIIIVGLTILAVIPNIAKAQPTIPDAKPVAVTLVNKPADDEWEVGDVQVTLSSGQTQILTKGGKCGNPRVSANGAVGWSLWNDSNSSSAEHTGETLRVRLPSGQTKDFKPNSRFVKDWNFVDHDSALVIASMGYHGYTFFIKYDIASGKALGRVEIYTPYEKLPTWAQPFSEEKP